MLVEVYEDGLVVYNDKRVLFRFTRTLEVEYEYKPRSNPLMTLELCCLVGYINLKIGYLVFVSKYTKVVDLPQYTLDVNRVEDVVLVPLVKDLCIKTLKRFSSNDGEEDYEDEGEKGDGDDTEESWPDNEPLDKENEPKHMIFTSKGILADSLKSNPQRSLNVRLDNSAEEQMSDGIMLSNLIYNKTLEDTRSIKSFDKSSTPPPSREASISPALVRKFKRYLKKFFSSGFYYSNTVDLTHRISVSLGKASPALPNTLEGIKKNTSSFLWNRSMLSEIIETCPAGYPSGVCMPLVQGFIGLIEVPLMKSRRKASLLNMLDRTTEPPTSAHVILISKRSTQRAGARYMRRGVDDNGKVANFVETDQLVLAPGRFARYTIVRGSIPLFFKQDPSKLQPAPIVQRSYEQNKDKMGLHYNDLLNNFDDVTSISLIEKGNREMDVGNLFQELSAELDLAFTWFDFHAACKGMKFENVEQLLFQDIENTHPMVSVKTQLERYGWYEDGNSQKGVFRINCIDCLDRTNIVSKFLCERILYLQIELWNLFFRAEKDFLLAYSNLWANNGDAISTQYASTNALKGDFTRTQKRNYSGVLNDAMLTLYRYYNGYFGDYFKQILIDFLLGMVGEEVFEQYESSLNNLDPNSSREVIITQKIIMDNTVNFLFSSKSFSDMLIGSWWVASPFKLNALRKVEMIGSMLFLTNRYVYLVVFENGEGVLKYFRIPTEHIVKMQYGHYFVSSHTPLARNPKRNIGFRLFFQGHVFERVHMAKEASKPGKIASSLKDLSKLEPLTSNIRQTKKDDAGLSSLAIKFPHHMEQKEIKSTVGIFSKICYCSSLEQSDLVSLQDAKSDTPFWKVLDHKVKRLIWA